MSRESAPPAPRLVTVGADGEPWAAAFTVERVRILHALDGRIDLHHIGSTSVPGCRAKPILDLMGTVDDLPDFDRVSGGLEGLGFEAMGEYGIPTRRYFRANNEAGERTRHLHVFAAGSPHVTRQLAFRDFLRAHPEQAEAYSALKVDLVSQPGVTRDQYNDGKDALVKALEREALLWRTRSP